MVCPDAPLSGLMSWDAVPVLQLLIPHATVTCTLARTTGCFVPWDNKLGACKLSEVFQNHHVRSRKQTLLAVAHNECQSVVKASVSHSQ